ncbi:PREDICTED: uncharacterized protein LOC109593202 [Amphimedon queenslandica]|uniref:Uncharacterized protein n=1 Tax=Amphimedon queenslandica TaxID=400682 RepID=A0A1X7VKY3_AMPQE|nr:PREDICTED: uncharacterized protein LOC109593202 [Amphimedon queenslandica]|eukprot:XP_019863952.1 PREDICTED: uncharacterized protein LOC109593202 [Amphimedon queenslandica]
MALREQDQVDQFYQLQANNAIHGAAETNFHAATGIHEETGKQASKRPKVNDDVTEPFDEVGASDMSRYTSNDVLLENAQDMETTMSNAKMLYEELSARWMDDLCSAEKFEMFCTPRLDEILKEAYLIESSIIEKKQKLKQELQMITRKIMASI